MAFPIGYIKVGTGQKFATYRPELGHTQTLARHRKLHRWTSSDQTVLLTFHFNLMPMCRLRGVQTQGRLHLSPTVFNRLLHEKNKIAELVKKFSPFMETKDLVPNFSFLFQTST
jgi:hypothetical protein